MVFFHFSLSFFVSVLHFHDFDRGYNFHLEHAFLSHFSSGPLGASFHILCKAPFPQVLTAWSQHILRVLVFVQFQMFCDVGELLFTSPFVYRWVGVIKLVRGKNKRKQ